MRRTLTALALAMLAALPLWNDASARSPFSSPSPDELEPGLLDTGDELEPGLLGTGDALEPGVLDTGDLLEPGRLDVEPPPPARPARRVPLRVRGRAWNADVLEPGVLTEADILEPGLLGEKDLLEPGLLDVDAALEATAPRARVRRAPGFVWDKDILEPGLLDVTVEAVPQRH